MPVSPPDSQAKTRSGAILASAPKTALAIRKPVRPARRDRRRHDRIDDRPGRRADLDRAEVALVVRRVAADQVPDAGVDRRLRERERRVDRAPHLRRRPLEVDDHPVAGDGDRDRDRDRVGIEAVLVDVVHEASRRRRASRVIALRASRSAWSSRAVLAAARSVDAVALDAARDSRARRRGTRRPGRGRRRGRRAERGRSSRAGRTRPRSARPARTA